MKNFENLGTFASIISQNASAYVEAFLKDSQAAEAVHQGFATLIYNPCCCRFR